MHHPLTPRITPQPWAFFVGWQILRGGEVWVTQCSLCTDTPTRLPLINNWSPFSDFYWGGSVHRLDAAMLTGFKSRRRRHMWVEFVVGSLLCSKRFFSGYSGFQLSSKTKTSPQFDLEHTDTFKRVHKNFLLSASWVNTGTIINFFTTLHSGHCFNATKFWCSN